MNSICMATYNGQDYLRIQIESILLQINQNDEVIIIDDKSNDNTVSIINSINDERIKLYINDVNEGEIFSFNRAIGIANGKYIFLADQDDIWMEGRLKKMITPLLGNNISCVSSNFKWINSDGADINIYHDGVEESDSDKNFKNIIDIFKGKTNYYGCAMVFNKKIKKIIYPIPRFVESHDLWIAIAANLMMENYHLNDNTLYKRSHSNNLTSTVSKRNLFRKLYSRIIFIKSIFYLYLRILRSKLNENK